MAWPVGQPWALLFQEHPRHRGAGWADPELLALLLGCWLAADALTTLLIAALALLLTLAGWKPLASP
jgi:hypothetical protein